LTKRSEHRGQERLTGRQIHHGRDGKNQEQSAAEKQVHFGSVLHVAFFLRDLGNVTIGL
jgi:hypothetical protein